MQKNTESTNQTKMAKKQSPVKTEAQDTITRYPKCFVGEGKRTTFKKAILQTRVFIINVVVDSYLFLLASTRLMISKS